MVPIGEQSELSFFFGLLHCSNAFAGAVCNESKRRRLARWWPMKHSVNCGSCSLGEVLRNEYWPIETILDFSLCVTVVPEPMSTSGLPWTRGFAIPVSTILSGGPFVTKASA